MVHTFMQEIDNLVLGFQFLPEGLFVFDLQGPDKYFPEALPDSLISRQDTAEAAAVAPDDVGDTP